MQEGSMLLQELQTLVHAGETARGRAPEDFHGGLSVGVVGRLEAQLLEAQPVKEHLQGSNEISEGQTLVTHHTCVA